MATKKRDYNIKKSYQKEIDLRSKSIPSKKVYSRKIKHKGNTWHL